MKSLINSGNSFARHSHFPIPVYYMYKTFQVSDVHDILARRQLLLIIYRGNKQRLENS